MDCEFIHVHVHINIINGLTLTLTLTYGCYFRPPGSGIFIVVNAITGAPLAIFQENRFMTDLRTGAAGAVALKHCTTPEQDTVGFIGCGAIAR